MAETWDESKPSGSRTPKLGDDDIREFKRAMRERMAEDHQFQATESPAFGAPGGYKIGKHKYLTLVEQASAKTTASDELAMRVADVSGNKEIMVRPPSAGTERQLTKNAGANINLASGDFANNIIPAGAHITKAINSNSAIEEIADFGIKAAQLDSGAVETAKIANYAVGSAQLNTSAVGADQLNTGAVETAKITDNGVTPSKTSHGFVPVYRIASEDASGKPSQPDHSDWQTKVSVPIKLPSGPTSINGQVEIKNESAAFDTYCRLAIGGQVSGQASINDDSYAWKTFNSAVDVSALTPGTVYTLVVQIKSGDPGPTAYLRGISLWWE